MIHDKLGRRSIVDRYMMEQAFSLPNYKLNINITGTSNVFKRYTGQIYYPWRFLYLLKVHSVL